MTEFDIRCIHCGRPHDRPAHFLCPDCEKWLSVPPDENQTQLEVEEE